MMTARLCFGLLAMMLLVSCRGSDTDIKQELSALAKSIPPARMDPLPEFREPETFKFEAFDLPDPFQPKGSPPKKASGRAP